MTRRFSWNSLVLQADPEHARDKRYVTEYEFSAPTGAPQRGARAETERTHEEGKRVFKANFDQRGPYSSDS